MMRSWLLALATVLAIGHAGPGWAQDFNAAPEVIALFVADQSDRNASLDIAAAAEREARDTTRRQAMRHLLDEGRLTTADDYFLAAFIFQHGRGDDCLLAHTLAVVALGKGKTAAGEIAANTLDRYLWDIGRAQIYGTQFMLPFNDDPASQGAYNTELVPDSVRQATGVPLRAAQAEQLRAYNQFRE